MQIVFTEKSGEYDIQGLTKDELSHLSKMIDVAPLPEKRPFYKLSREIDKVISISSQPKKT